MEVMKWKQQLTKTMICILRIMLHCLVAVVRKHIYKHNT